MTVQRAGRYFERALVGVPLLLSFFIVIYGLIFVPPLIAVGFVSLLTFAICGIPLFLSSAEANLAETEIQDPMPESTERLAG